MYHLSHPLSNAHGGHQASDSSTTATHYSSAKSSPNETMTSTVQISGGYDEGRSSGAFAETMKQIDEDFYRVFPAARNPVVPTSIRWVYDPVLEQYVHVADPDYQYVPEHHFHSFANIAHSASQRPSFHYNYSTHPSPNGHPSHPTSVPPARTSAIEASASPTFGAQQAFIQPKLELSSTSSIEPVPPHLVVPSQQPMFDFQAEIQRWGDDVEMHHPYLQTSHGQDNASSGVPSSPPLSDTLSPTSPMSPMTPTHSEHLPTARMAEPEWPQSHASYTYPTEYQDPPSWPVYSAPCTHRPIAPAPAPLGHHPSSPESHHHHLRHGSPYRKSPLQSGSSHHRIPSPRLTHQHGVGYASHRLRGSPSYSRQRRSSSPPMDYFPHTSYETERGPSPVPLSPLADQKKPPEKKPPLACLFCRGRKIACGPPSPGSKDRTCNQCQRRSLKCEYPLESRRGMRKKKTAVSAESGKDEPGATTSSEADATPAVVDEETKPVIDESTDSSSSSKPASGIPPPSASTHEETVMES